MKCTTKLTVLFAVAVLIMLWRSEALPLEKEPKKKVTKTVDVTVIRNARRFIEVTPEQSMQQVTGTAPFEEPEHDDPNWPSRPMAAKNASHRPKSRRRKRNARVNRDEDGSISRFPTNARVFKIANKAGYFLRVRLDGSVDGTTDEKDAETLLLFESHGSSIIRIKGILSNRYLVMDQTGVPTAEYEPPLLDSLFRWTREENLWDTFASYRFFFDQKYDMLVGITKDGSVKMPWKSSPGQHATQFVTFKQGAV